MKITHVGGYVWPLSITCNTCGVTFEADKPTDLRRHIKYGYDHQDGHSIPHVERRYVTVSCPCCGEVRELQESQVPAIFGNAIPMAEGENPIYG